MIWLFFLAKEGILIGQCSELCGAGHYGMPIVVEALLPFDYFSAIEEDFWKNSKNDDILTYCPLFTKNEFILD